MKRLDELRLYNPSVGVSAVEREAAKRAAATRGISIAELVRRLILTTSNPPITSTDAAVHKLIRKHKEAKND